MNHQKRLYNIKTHAVLLHWAIRCVLYTETFFILFWISKKEIKIHRKRMRHGKNFPRVISTHACLLELISSGCLLLWIYFFRCYAVTIKYVHDTHTAHPYIHSHILYIHTPARIRWVAMLNSLRLPTMNSEHMLRWFIFLFSQAKKANNNTIANEIVVFKCARSKTNRRCKRRRQLKWYCLRSSDNCDGDSTT